MISRGVVVSAMAVACALVLPDYRADRVSAAGLPCEFRELPKAPRRLEPPRGLRILSDLLNPLVRAVPVIASGSANEYYESLASRPDCLIAHPLRDQAQLDAYPTINLGHPKKKPIVYDPEHDAARIDIYAPESADIQGKYLPVPIDRSVSSWLLTFDFRFDEQFRWLPERGLVTNPDGVTEEKGYMIRHKTWRFVPKDEAHWLMLRTDYQHAAKVGEFAEVFVSVPSGQYVGPSASRGAPGWYGEMLQPRTGEFFLEPNRWTRMWLFVEDFDKEVCHLSVWVADERRLVQLLDRVTLYPPTDGMVKFHIEYDTSGDFFLHTKMAHSWNRNVVVLKNVSRAAVGELLKQP